MKFDNFLERMKYRLLDRLEPATPEEVIESELMAIRMYVYGADWEKEYDKIQETTPEMHREEIQKFSDVTITEEELDKYVEYFIELKGLSKDEYKQRLDDEYLEMLEKAKDYIYNEERIERDRRTFRYDEMQRMQKEDKIREEAAAKGKDLDTIHYYVR